MHTLEGVGSMKIAVWSHQVTTSYLQASIGPSDVGRPFSEIWEKVADGLSWMNNFDHHARALGSIDDVLAREVDSAAEDGREWKPWVVVAGTQPGVVGTGYASAEGKLAGQIAVAGAGPGEVPVVIVDLEPHYHGGSTPQFWRDDLGAGPAHVAAFCAAFLEVTGSSGEIWVAPDARRPHLEPVSFSAWVAQRCVTRILPQTYTTDFHPPAESVTIDDFVGDIDRANALLREYGVTPDRIAHVLPANAAPAVLCGAIDYTHSQGNRAPSLWQRLTVTEELCAALEAFADPWSGWTPSTPPAPTVALEAVRAELTTIGDAVERLRRLVG